MILLVSNAQRKLMWTLSFAALFNITLNLFLIPRFSSMGAAFASALTEGFVVLAGAFIAFRHIGYRPSAEGLSPIFFASCGMAIVLFLLHGRLSFLLLGLGAVRMAHCCGSARE